MKGCLSLHVVYWDFEKCCQQYWCPHRIKKYMDICMQFTDRVTEGTKFLSKTERNKEVIQPSPLAVLLLLVPWLEFVPGYLTGLELVCQEYSSSLPSHFHGHAGSWSGQDAGRMCDCLPVSYKIKQNKIQYKTI